MALGKHQLAFLAKMAGTGRAVIVGDKLIRSLAQRGLLRPLADGSKGDGSFYTITAHGLRAVADALDSGAIPLTTIDHFRKGDR